MTPERSVKPPIRRLSPSDRMHGRKWRSRRRREWPDDLSWDDRLSDRLNPVLARDARQMARAPATSVALLGSCVFIVLKLQAAYELSPSIDEVGRRAELARRLAFDSFHDIVGALLAVSIVFVPLRAFFSMRDEVAPGAAEQCVLSGIEPAAAFRGKLICAMISVVAMIGIFAPALALFGATRIVDVGTIVALGWLVLLASVVAVSLAIAVASSCANPALRTPLFAAVALVLGLVALDGYVSFPVWIEVLAREVRLRPFSLFTLSLVPVVLCAVLASILGVAAFNRNDVERRVIAVRGWVLGVCTFGSLLAVAGSGWRATDVGILGAWLLAPFACAAVLERQRMSSQMRPRLPESAWLLVLGTPLWPGRSRGFLFVCVAYGGLLVCTVPFATRPQEVAALLGVVAWLVSGCAILYALRQRMSSSRVFWVGASGLLVLLLTPWSYNAARGMELGTWNPFEICNPFVFTSRLRAGGGLTDGLGSPVVLLGLVTAVACLFVLPAVARNLSTRGDQGSGEESMAAGQT